jgi:hypothetical protein
VPLLKNLRPDAPFIDLNSLQHTGRRADILKAGYSQNLYSCRPKGDYHTLSKKTVVDPRISLGWKFTKDMIIRGAAGIYHQFPRIEFYMQSDKFELKPEQATHYILGYEFNKNEGVFLFRVEGYYKQYKDLVSFDPNTFRYNSGGNGFAKGVDVFIKSSVANKYATWISYAYTDSKRKANQTAPEISANYDITHNLTFVGSINITDNIVTGMTYRISTGKPYTPVTGSVYDSAYSLYAPIYGVTNSGRFPTYQRMDVNFQYIFSFFGRFAVAVFSVNNVLNQKNLYDYTYNFDYSEQKEIITTNKRQFYLGLGVQF